MRVKGNVSAAVDVTGRLDRGHPARPRQLDVGPDVGPVPAAVARHPEDAVVRADIQQVRVARRFGEGRGAAVAGACDLGRNNAQPIAALDRAEDILAGTVENDGCWFE